ncbi:MAG: hypothetical protein H7249_07020 [Chitinophagaceae bacterium]|nr:hypothetical protein [Oligoflexus sp.]
MKSRKKILFPAVFGVFIVAGLVSGFLYKKNVKTSFLNNQASSKGSGFAVPSLHLARGDMLEYELSFTGQTPESPVTFELDGNLRVTVFDEESDYYRVSLSLETDHTLGFETLDPKYKDLFLAGLNQPVAARLGRFGFDLTLEPQSMPVEQSLEFWQGVVDRTRVRLPSRITDLQFSQSEAFLTETLTAHYTVDAGSHPGSNPLYIQKSIASSQQSKRQVEGETIVQMKNDLEEIDTLEFRSSETIDSLKLTSQNAIKLRASRHLKIDEKAVVELERKSKAAKAPGGDIKGAIQANVLGSHDLPDIWASLDKNADQQSYLLLKAWIYLHPQDMGALTAKLKDLGPDDPKLRSAIKALTAVGSPESQHVLVDLLQHSRNELAMRVASSLGFVQNPTAETEKALISLVRSQDAPELGRRAELALGVVGHTLKGIGEDARADALEKAAFERLKASGDERQSITSMGMIGNLGPKSKQDLSPYWQSSDPAIRAQAYFALRASPESDMPQFLVDAYIAEPAMSVRRQILEALVLRTPDDQWYSAVDKLSSKKLDEEEQLVLAQTLVKNARVNREESMRLLSTMERKDGSDRYKSTLAQYQNLARKGASF